MYTRAREEVSRAQSKLLKIVFSTKGGRVMFSMLKTPKMMRQRNGIERKEESVRALYLGCPKR